MMRVFLKNTKWTSCWKEHIPLPPYCYVIEKFFISLKVNCYSISMFFHVAWWSSSRHSSSSLRRKDDENAMKEQQLQCNREEESRTKEQMLVRKKVLFQCFIFMANLHAFIVTHFQFSISMTLSFMQLPSQPSSSPW